MEGFQARFGESLRKRRKERSWSQDDLASFAGLSKQHVSIIERGRGRPCIDTLFKLANAFGVPVKVLFDFQHEADTVPEVKRQIRVALDEVDDAAGLEVLFTRVLHVFLQNRGRG